MPSQAREKVELVSRTRHRQEGVGGHAHNLECLTEAAQGNGRNIRLLRGRLQGSFEQNMSDKVTRRHLNACTHLVPKTFQPRVAAA